MKTVFYVIDSPGFYYSAIKGNSCTIFFSDFLIIRKFLMHCDEEEVVLTAQLTFEIPVQPVEDD